MPDSASETIAAIARARVIFTGVVAAASLGIGLAFGLGGRDQASRLLQRMAPAPRH